MIKFLDLQKINQQYAKELKEEASNVIDSGWYLLGENLKSFESSLTNFLGTKHAIGTGNGLDALKLIFRSYIEMGKMNEGDEIIVPANTYIASVLAITDNRLKPILIEPSIDTYNINIELIEKQITKKTKGILLVHLYGRICWDNKIEELAKKHNLIIIEDNAQAIGASWKDKKAGNLGDVAALSFYPGKNLGALGDAGAIVTNNNEIAKLSKALGNYGSLEKYMHEYKGVNSRMDEIQAAFLNIKLKYIEKENEQRRIIAKYYIDNIKNDSIILPSLPDNKLEHVWHLFVIRHHKRAELMQHLLKNEIQALIHYPIPIHKQKAYHYLNNMDLPITESLSDTIISLPISPYISEEEVDKVVESLNSFK